jgi:hypothetical protein
MNVLFRVLTTAAVVVLPTLMYLGLWRFLQYLRDDELIRKIQESEGVPADGSPVLDIDTGSGGRPHPPGSSADGRRRPNGSVPGSQPRPPGSVAEEHAGSTAPGVQCPDCGMFNDEGMAYCRSCLSELPSTE